jgi:hypothetical protein
MLFYDYFIYVLSHIIWIWLLCYCLAWERLRIRIVCSLYYYDKSYVCRIWMKPDVVRLTFRKRHVEKFTRKWEQNCGLNFSSAREGFRDSKMPAYVHLGMYDAVRVFQWEPLFSDPFPQLAFSRARLCDVSWSFGLISVFEFFLRQE